MVRSPNGNRVILVTGANRGIGLAAVTELARRGHTVLLGARDPGRGAAAAAPLGGDVHPLVVDVTSQDSIALAAAAVASDYGWLDTLVNNAGINAGYCNPPSRTRLEDMHAIFDTDVFGVVAVTTAFLPLLRKSAAPRIINVSSYRGSLGSAATWVGSWSATYGTAKSALNAITAHYARELGAEGFAVTAVSPGHVATDLTGGNAPLSPAEGARTIIELATAATTNANGQFLDENGNLVPW
jgi:NAD(P)-dependent dehydrogenase (short-subunit alcohol dehydrogenase family)